MCFLFSIDDDDDEEFDLLRRGDYVEVAHFGGGESGAPLSSEDFLQQVMVDKRQKQLEKEENIKLTEELDKNWSTIRNLIKHKGAKDESNMGETEDYDIFLNQLMFGSDDQKATVSTVKLTCEGVKEADKTPSPNVLIIDYLQTIMTTDDVDIILKQIDNLLSIEVKRLNSTVVKKAFNLLKAPEMRKCSLKSLGILMFLLTFVELKQQVLLKLINFLRVLKYDSIDEIAKRLLVCDVLNSSFPDHFFPEIIASLQNILILFEPVYASVFIPSFSFEKIASSEILCWTEDMDFDCLPEFTFRSVFKDEISSSSKRKSIIFTAVINLIEKIFAKYSNLDASQAIFSRMMPILVNLQEKFTEPMSQRLFGLIENLNNSKQLHFLAFERKKPVMLKMLDPRIGDSRRRDDKKKLQRVVKREFKSAARELRKDGAFIRDIVLKDTIAKDEARKRKVKKLMSEIAQERSMFKKAR